MARLGDLLQLHIFDGGVRSKQAREYACFMSLDHERVKRSHLSKTYVLRQVFELLRLIGAARRKRRGLAGSTWGGALFLAQLAPRTMHAPACFCNCLC